MVSPHILRHSQHKVKLMELEILHRFAPRRGPGATVYEGVPGGVFRGYFDFDVQAYLWMGKAEIGYFVYFELYLRMEGPRDTVSYGL